METKEQLRQKRQCQIDDIFGIIKWIIKFIVIVIVFLLIALFTRTAKSQDTTEIQYNGPGQFDSYEYTPISDPCFDLQEIEFELEI